MNEEQYRELCEACDRVLLAPDSTIERVAVPWLHVIREHPLTLSKYVDIFKHTKDIKALSRRWLRDLRNMAGWVRQIGRALRSDGEFWFASKELPHEVDVLFVSHLLNESHAGDAADFYFGELPDELVGQGHSVAIALLNHSEQSAATLAYKWKDSAVPRVILSCSLGYSEEIALHQRLKMESLRLRTLAKNETVDLLRKVLSRSSQEALTNESLATLRLSRQINRLVDKLKPKAVVTIHEGHAWERVAFAAARSSAPKVLCVGYQHAAVFCLQHAIRRSLGREYNPDCILTAGPVGKKQLELAPDLKGVPISVLGSNRSFKADKFELPPTQIRGQSNKRACLVLPEGIASECHLLFEFSLDCAQACPDIQFIWRLHPVVTFESLVSHNVKLRDLPGNIILSQENLDTDIARCSWALYRGTTAIIQAVAAGVRPLYLHVQGEMSIDPLYELGAWHTNIENINDLKHAIETDEANSPLDGETAFMLAKQYCRDFFSPLDVDTFKAAIFKDMENPK
ncbi:MAG: hypothetical protein WC762_04555 [Methylobacter sp.]